MDDLERELAPIEDLESDDDSCDDYPAKEIKGSKLPLVNPMPEGELQSGCIHFLFSLQHGKYDSMIINVWFSIN